MPRYKLSPEERAAEAERKANLRNIMNGLNVTIGDGQLGTYIFCHIFCITPLDTPVTLSICLIE